MKSPCLFMLSLAVPVAIVAFDARADNNLLPRANQVAYVLASLDERDRALQNFDCTVVETQINVRVSDGKKRHIDHCEYELRRLGSKVWMKLALDDANGSAINHSTLAWDGRLGKELVVPPFSLGAEPDGVITSKESTQFVLRGFNGILGVRFWVHNQGWLVTDFLRFAQLHAKSVDVSTDGGRLRVTVRGTDYDKWVLWIDPTRSNMVVRTEFKYGADDKVSFQFTDEVTGSQEVRGVWVPTDATERSSMGMDEDSLLTYHVKNFQVGTLHDADVDVLFPVGASVIDGPNRIAYTVAPGGKFKLGEYADLDAHVHRVPRGVILVDHVDADTAKLYENDSLSSADDQPLPDPADPVRGHARELVGVRGPP